MKDLETRNVKIRKFKLEDAEDVHKNLATEKSLAECSGYHIHKNIKETEILISSFIREYEMNELVWAIEEKSTGTVIGFINALEFSRQNKLCNIKFGIALKWVESGFMEESLNRVLQYLFEEEGFEIVVSEFYDGCKKIIKAKSDILENVGMKKEAVLRNRRINTKTQEPEGKIIYSILKEEFDKKNRKCDQ